VRSAIGDTDLDAVAKAMDYVLCPEVAFFEPVLLSGIPLSLVDIKENTMKPAQPVLSAFVLFIQFTLGAICLSAEDESCKPVSGPFSSVVVGGAECESPVGICTSGLLEGNFHAIYEFTMLTLVPADPNNPALFTYTGISVITLRSGQQLFSIDTGIMNMQDPTAVPFVTTAQITGGTGQYQSGQIVATGILNLLTGEAVGTHSGEICKDKKDKSS
jgi:hypothetical protein